MEGVGARLGRSSTRYGPATVFNGPVRKWKKKWVHVLPSNGNNNNSNNHHSHHSHSNGTAAAANGNNGSHLLLYKWTPLSQRDSSNGNNSNGNNGDKSSGGKEDAVDAAAEEPPRRKFKYIPIAVLEEQKKETAENETAEKIDDETKASDSDPIAVEVAPKNDGFDEKPDINDVPMEESQENNQLVRQDLNESTLDLSLGLKAHDGDADSKANQARDGRLETAKSGGIGT